MVDPVGEDLAVRAARTLFERAPVAMLVWSPDAAVIAANRAAGDLCGRQAADLVGETAAGVVGAPIGPATVGVEPRGGVAGGIGALQGEVRFVRPDATVAWGDAATEAVVGSDGQVEYWQSVIVDITAQRRGDETRSRLAAIVESSTDAVIGSTLTGEITSWNEGAERLYGYRAQDVVGRDGHFLLTGDGEDEVRTHLGPLRDGLRVEPYETTRRHRDGTTVRVSVAASPIRDAAGRIVGVASVARDLSERDRAAARFRGLLDAAPDAVLGIDGRGRIVTTNPRAEELFGFEPGELAGRRLAEVFPDGDLAWASTSASPARGRPGSIAAQEEGRRSDGTRFPAEVTLAAVAAEEGPLLVLGIRDGTERRQAAIVEASSDAISIQTVDGVITSWNPGAEQMYGYRSSEAVGCRGSMLVPPDRLGELDALVERVKRGLAVRNVETQRVCKDGRVLDVSLSISPIRDATRTVVGLSATARDITTAKRADAALRISEARKAAILEASLDGIVTMDHDGVIIEFNPAAERVFGYPRDEAVGAPMAELLIPPSLRGDHARGLANFLRTGSGPILGRRIETTAARSDGTELPVELTVNRVDLPGPPMFTAFIRDLTEQHRRAAERHELEERLRLAQRLEGLGQLAGGVAHDFNNLLSVILNYAIFVADATTGDPTAHADVQQIIDAAERAAGLTRQLLTFARREEVHPQLLNLTDVLEGMHNLLSRSIGEHIELVIHPAVDVPPVRADRGQIEQVLLNLAVNARDAMPDGGTLIWETAVTVLDEAYCRLHPAVASGTFVEVSVSDTGVGMSPEVVAHVFDPFFTTKPSGEGTGLGLATAYGIVAEAGGTINVYSEPGVGTTFRLYFPLAAGPALVPPTGRQGQARRGHGEIVLLVEDEPALMDVTARILRRHGYEVIQAPDGNTAVAAAAAQRIDVLLTDAIMPGMSGRQVADEVLRLQPQASVVYMSGYSRGVLGPQFLKDLEVDLLQKPFDEHALLDRIAASLPPSP